MNHRLDQCITLRRMTELLDIALLYLCHLERNRHQPPEKLLLDRMADVLVLTEAERNILYDLAAMHHAEISPNHPGFIMENEVLQSMI